MYKRQLPSLYIEQNDVNAISEDEYKDNVNTNGPADLQFHSPTVNKWPTVEGGVNSDIEEKSWAGTVDGLQHTPRRNAEGDLPDNSASSYQSKSSPLEDHIAYLNPLRGDLRPKYRLSSSQFVIDLDAVSYTHLTLPTIYSV